MPIHRTGALTASEYEYMLRKIRAAGERIVIVSHHKDEVVVVTEEIIETRGAA